MTTPSIYLKMLNRFAMICYENVIDTSDESIFLVYNTGRVESFHLIFESRLSFWPPLKIVLKFS